MESVKVTEVKSDYIKFSNGTRLKSYHRQDCCEHHYIDFSDLSLSDFEGLEFILEDEKFFNRIEDYGIELVPIKGHTIKVPGYGSNNGYYSSNLSLILNNTDRDNIEYDVSECQDYASY